MRKVNGGICLSVCLLALATSGCLGDSARSAEGGGDKETRKTETLSVMKPLYPGQTFYQDSELERLVEAATGVQVTYDAVPYNEYRTKFALRMAGGDISDIVNTYYPNDPEHNALIDQGVFLPLDDLLPQFPRLWKSFSETTWNYMRSGKDGKIYGVPWMRDRGGLAIAIRTDWLERLGLKRPQTLEELTQTLIAFRDRDPDGNVRRDTIPMSFKDHQIWNISPFMTLFGLNPGWHPEEGNAERLQHGWLQPEAKEAVKLLRSYRLQGLLDPELFVGKTFGIDKFFAGKVGVLIMNINDFRQIAARSDMKAELIDPISHNGHDWSLLLPATPISRTNQISSKAGSPKAALRYLEYQVTEGYDYIQYGVEGKTYRIENGLKIPFAEADKDPRYSTNVGLELLQPEWLFNDLEKYTKFLPEASAKYMADRLETYERHIVYDYLRPDVVLPQYEEKWPQLRQLLENSFTFMLIDTQLDVDQAFAAMQTKWASLGGEAVTEEINRLQRDKSTPSYTYMRRP